MEKQNLDNLKEMEIDLFRLKEKIKVIYNKINRANSDKDRDDLVEEFKSMINSINKIQNNCNKLDNISVAEDFLQKTDDNTFPLFEKECYESLIFMAQLLRGNVKGITDYKEKIN